VGMMLLKSPTPNNFYLSLALFGLQAQAFNSSFRYVRSFNPTEIAKQRCYTTTTTTKAAAATTTKPKNSVENISSATTTTSLQMSGKTWFEKVFGFKESRNYDKVRSSFRLEEDDTVLITVPPPGTAAERCFYIGPFGTPSVQELRDRLNELDNTAQCATAAVAAANATTTYETDFVKPVAKRSKSNDDLGTLTFSHIIGSAGELHLDPQNADSVFQAASQFNCLEMVSPKVTPNDGITRYSMDHTQGPVCAMSCPAATLYRNYLVHDGKGQKDKQIDTLKDVGEMAGNVNRSSGKTSYKYWKMENGYALPARKYAMTKLRIEFENGNLDAERLMKAVRVGVHEDTEVFDLSSSSSSTKNPPPPPHRVAQVYCSAVPIGYDYNTPLHDWKPFAQLVLDATYDATLATGAILARKKKKRVKVFLTKVGGGVFANPSTWIIDAMRKALERYRSYPLDVYLVHFGGVESGYEHVLNEIK